MYVSITKDVFLIQGQCSQKKKKIMLVSRKFCHRPPVATPKVNECLSEMRNNYDGGGVLKTSSSLDERRKNGGRLHSGIAASRLNPSSHIILRMSIMKNPGRTSDARKMARYIIVRLRLPEALVATE